MIVWLLLAAAILAEVTASMSMQAAVKGTKWWYALVVAGYGTAFLLMSLALATGFPLGVAYGIWTAVGVVLTALLGRLIFKHPFTWVMALGVALIIGGVLLVDLGRPH